MTDLFEEYPGKWAVITTHTGKIIGRVIEENEKEMKVQPAFEYSPRLVQQGSGLGKDVIVIPYDLFATLDSVVRIRGVSTICWFDELIDIDRSQYEKVTRQGAEIALETKALKSNIILPNKTTLKLV